MTHPRKAPKLVRDKIPAIIRAEGREPVIRVITGEKLTEALNAKFLEEYDEFLAASQPNDRFAELADLLEVVISMAAHLGMSEADLLALCYKKRAARGGFAEGFFFEGCLEEKETAG